MQQLNPVQLQIYQHFKSKVEEQNTVLTQNNLELQKIQKDIVGVIQKVQESELTKGKLNIIESEANMYKLVGAALIKVTREEVDNEVKGRLDLLTKTLKNQEENKKRLHEAAKTAQENMIRLDSEFKYAIQQVNK